MNAIIEDKLDEMYSSIMSKPNQILEIFNNFFGEDRVDMQGFPSIEEFKNWMMNVAGLGGFVPRDSAVYTEDFNYYDYRHKSLSSVSEEKCIEILNSASIVSIVNVITGANVFKDGFILVHFPHVRVTNEYDKFVDINHLYAKVKILLNGTMDGYFALNRAEYSYLHISNNYMHSHVSDIPYRDFTRFQTPCTGTGPINDTMSNLNREFDSDIWELFCLELSKYVEVESIAGTPYHRLESLGTSSNDIISSRFEVINVLPYYGSLSNDMLRKFTSYFIKQGKLKFDYRDGSYSLGMSFTEYMLTISNEFIDWYNDQFNKGVYNFNLRRLTENGVLRSCIIAGGRIYEDGSSSNVDRYRGYIGKKVCTFKGQDVLVSITDINEVEEDNKSFILDTRAALYVLSKILHVINYKYGKPEQTDSEGNRVSEKVRYF